MDSQLLPELNEAFFTYVKHHLGEDVLRLRLKRDTRTDFSQQLAITQIEARNRGRNRYFSRQEIYSFG